MRLHLIVTCLLSAAVIAADGEHTFQLEWQKSGFNKDVYVSLDRKEPFASEPDTAGRNVYRGILEFGQGENKKQAGFLLDESEKTLYLDQNLDSDLTNNPNGIFKSDEQGGFSLEFKDIQLSLELHGGIFKYYMSALFHPHDSYSFSTFYVRSGYSGTCDLYGKQWQFEVCDSFRGKIEATDHFSVSLPGKNENRISNAQLQKIIFVDGHCYDINFEFKKSEAPTLWCTLKEKKVPTGTLLVKGQSINQLVLGDDRMLILPELSNEPVTVPAGDFAIKQFSLKLAKKKPAVSANVEKHVSIPENGQTELAIGGPLKSSVDIKRKGNTLELSYKIIGAGGEEYNSSQMLNYANKPTVSIYKGDMQLASGTFEYG